MTDNEAIKIIQDRIQELVSMDAVKVEMVKMHHQGKTDEEIQSWLTISAIGTLCGVQV